LGRLKRPSWISQEFAGHHHGVGLTSLNNLIRLFRFGYQTYGTSWNI
jgi:hypothetical protein